jgi:hypothetical protein
MTGPLASSREQHMSLENTGKYLPLAEQKYIQQYLRVRRWYDRFEVISTSRDHSMTSPNYEDDMYALFINCYHLKDWVANDSESGITKEEVEKFMRESENMRICGDLCIGSKHLEIRNPKIGKDTRVARRHFWMGLGGGPLVSVKYEIAAGGKSYDAFALASKCLEEWDDFLSQHNRHFALNKQILCK